MDLAAFAAAPYAGWSGRFPGQRAVGYLCSYVPEEIIHAAGFAPVRLVPAAGPSPRADAHLQSYTCSLARGCLDRTLTGELAFLEGVAFAHTCDTMQCLADVWREAELAAGKPSWVGWAVQPVNLASPRAQAYLVAELRRFAGSLGAIGGAPVSDESLRASIALYNANRRLLADVNTRHPLAPAAARWAITNAAQFMPPEDFAAVAPHAIAALRDDPRLSASTPLVLSGATQDDPALLGLIEDVGGRVAGDDLCNGERYYDTPIAETGDPWAALAGRYLNRAPCPCKHHGLDARQDHMLSLVRQRGARGVIFFLKKFCEPHAWDYPPLAAALEKAGVPHLLVETEASTPLGVVRTRIEALLEILELG
jgi:bzd-type benzoyl-CoA reductase N subunit